MAEKIVHITLANSNKEESISCAAFNITGNGCLLLADNAGTVTAIYNQDYWRKIRVSSIQTVGGNA